MVINGRRSGLVEIEKHSIKTSNLIVVNQNSMSSFSIGKVISDYSDLCGKFVLYYAHAVQKVSAPGKTYFVVFEKDIIAELSPGANDEFIPEITANIEDPDSKWR